MYQLVLSGDTLSDLHAELIKAIGEVSTNLISEIRSEPEQGPTQPSVSGPEADTPPWEEPQPEPVKPAPVEVPVSAAITLTDLREVLRTLRDKKGRSAIQQVLARFKADTVPDIKEADYADAVFYAQELYNAE